jgi:tRNA dimethylallyltransferase
VPESAPEPIYLAGATASGKTAVAVELAQMLGGEIVNVDAYQVYQGFEIVAAIPSDEERGDIPHHLFACIDPAENHDVSRHTALAEPMIADIRQRGRHPIVVGGSGLYLKALTHGLAPTPKGDPHLRETLEKKELQELVTWLQKVDPEGAAVTNLKNRRYVTRNLEITLLAGRPASEIKREWQRNAPDIIGFHLSHDRERLYQRIHERTSAMFAAGLVEKVRQLGTLSDTAAHAIGISEVRALLAGQLEQQQCIDAIRQATRRYAKRQGTWFRRETTLQSICVPADATPQSLAREIAAAISSST